MQRWHFCPLLSLSFNSYYYLPFLPLFLALLLLLFFSPFLLCLRFLFIVWPFFYLFISLLFWVVPRRTTRTVTRKERRTHRKIGGKEERKKNLVAGIYRDGSWQQLAFIMYAIVQHVKYLSGGICIGIRFSMWSREGRRKEEGSISICVIGSYGRQ